MRDEWRSVMPQIIACDREFCDLCRCPLDATGWSVAGQSQAREGSDEEPE